MFKIYDKDIKFIMKRHGIPLKYRDRFLGYIAADVPDWINENARSFKKTLRRTYVL